MVGLVLGGQDHTPPFGPGEAPYHTPEKVGTLAALAAPRYFSAPGGEKEFEDSAKKEFYTLDGFEPIV